MSKTKVVSLIILIVISMCLPCMAKQNEELKVIEKQETIAIDKADIYKNSIKNEIVSDKVTYKLSNIKETKNNEKLTKDKEIVEELIVTTNNKTEVLNVFERDKQISEDGYNGILKIQSDSLEIVVNESYKEQYKETIDKKYNNVSQNELNEIPKEIQEKGTIYYLITPEWKVNTTEKIGGVDVPLTYNGIMHYEAIKTRNVIKNYKATVMYKGTIEKEEIKSITYKLTYEEIPSEADNTIAVPVIATTTSGIIIFSGIIILRRKNVKVYNYTSNGSARLVKKQHINKNNPMIDITILRITSNKFKIILSDSIYKELRNTNVTIKYFDRQFIYHIEDKEFEINV